MRRSKSPGIQTNFYDLSVEDFKRPWGMAPPELDDGMPRAAEPDAVEEITGAAEPDTVEEITDGVQAQLAATNVFKRDENGVWKVVFHQAGEISV